MPSSRAAALLVVLFVAMPAVAKVPLQVCKESCAARVDGDCGGLAKKKQQKRCRTKLWRQCRRGRIVCTATGTTLRPGSGCVTTFVVGPQLAGGTDQAVAGADLNGDGKRDLLLAANPSVMVRLGNGDGTFGELTGVDVGGDVHGIAVADLDGNGTVDLAAANFMSDPPPTGPSTVVNVSVLMGRGDGSFEGPIPYFVGTRDFHDVVAADFNGDNKPDLVVATQPSVVVLLNNGNGTFAGKVSTPRPTSAGPLRWRT
ncbi:MAG TPA: VCBS repeat-containing protein [Candidatus Eisenbacteria bacterium]|nr:VCBS repeat-containing protein [Candidatus Eisenbacteria bacterium]